MAPQELNALSLSPADEGTEVTEAKRVGVQCQDLNGWVARQFELHPRFPFRDRISIALEDSGHTESCRPIARPPRDRKSKDRRTSLRLAVECLAHCVVGQRLTSLFVQVPGDVHAR